MENTLTVVITSRALILNSQNELLLVTHEGDDFWYTPGGKVEGEENLIEAAKREVYEELGLKVILEKLVYVDDYISDHSGESKHFIAFYFFGKTDQDIKEKWLDKGGTKPIKADFFGEDDIQEIETIYPKFLKDEFWKDLSDEFKENRVYKNTN